MTDISFFQLISMEQARQTLEAHYKITGVPSTILDNNGKLLIEVGSKDICTRFHRLRPVALECRVECETCLKEHLPDFTGKYLDHKCGNGLRNTALPIIIAGVHLATFCTGPFFYSFDKPDAEYFRRKAEESGLDGQSYLEALDRVPVLTGNQMDDLMSYYLNLAGMLAEMGMKNLELAREIKERKIAEQALRQSETTLREIFETIPDQLHIVDKDFRLRHSNRHEVYTYASGNVCGRNPHCYKAIYSRDEPCENCQALEVFKTGRPVIRENYYPKTGYVEIHAYPVFDASGDVTMAIKHIRDINERKRAEEKWRTLYNSLPGGSFTVNNQYIIEDVNDVLCAVTGYTRDELIGRLCAVICPKGPHLCPIFDLGKESIDNDETSVKAKDGRLVPIIKSARRMPAGDRELIVENFQDITDRKQLEEQLRHAQKMEAIGQLAGGVAHDFNNILTAIVGYANLMQIKMGEKDQLRKFADQIVYSVERGSSLTRGLLAFSRRNVVDLKPVWVNEIMEKAENLLSRLVPEYIGLSFVTSGNLVVNADSMQVEQILLNLVTNARDAMPEGGTLTIRTELIEIDDKFVRTHGYGEPGAYVRISVSDTGIGIDKQALERIFEPFYTTKDVGRGTGLGLSIVYGIIRQHNGYINVYSEPGVGTTFKVYLPAIGVEAEKMENFRMTAPSRGSETVLLAEDDPMVRYTTKSLLEEFGYMVVEAGNGTDAVEKFKTNGDEIRLLILDVIMPGKNGKEVYDEIKRIRPDMEALFMSGYTDDILSGRGILEENLHFISKPLMQNVFLKKVREILDKRPGNGHTGQPGISTDFLLESAAVGGSLEAGA